MKVNKKRGFTLIELLIVISILGILTSLLLANMQNARARGRDARRKKDLNELRTALRMYYNDYQSYPSGLNGQIRGCNPPQTFTWGNPFSCGTNTYMSLLPKDPLSSQNYYYAQTGSGEGFVVYACLENRSDPDGSNSCGSMSCSTNWCFRVVQD
ncbi:MAG: type II secretion system GspH family protein [Candidatus Omnitrophica bacterium]|nr:type II secretion system GspH family protein [Candidatus Omnitrophota bacterium]